MTNKRLVRPYDLIDQSTLEDFALAIMAGIEESLINAGAKPGVDYTYRDLLQASTPIITEQLKSGSLTFSLEWND